MIDPIDLQGLYGWLRDRGASASLVSYLSADLAGPEPGSPEGLAWRECELVLEGLLVQSCDPRPDERRLDVLAAVALRFGFDEHTLARLIGARLGMTERRLRAYAALGLPLDATPDEIKATHRVLVKALHPDRMSAADPEARRAAEQMLARVNQARSVLQSPSEEVTLEHADDVGLGEPLWDDDDDEPTETNLLERVPAPADEEADLTDHLEECW